MTACPPLVSSHVHKALSGHTYSKSTGEIFEKFCRLYSHQIQVIFLQTAQSSREGILLPVPPRRYSLLSEIHPKATGSVVARSTAYQIASQFVLPFLHMTCRGPPPCCEASYRMDVHPAYRPAAVFLPPRVFVRRVLLAPSVTST